VPVTIASLGGSRAVIDVVYVAAMANNAGRVVLVGAGPGDPELLTLRGARALEQAEVVVYDRLVTEEILALASPAATLIAVGKHKGGGWSQSAINDILISHALAGRNVVRLKGGDPFLFGRGGEECDELARHGIAFDVVPGVSSAIAAPAAIGIPITHRGIANACTIISGHVLTSYDWNALARVPGTLVVLMAATTASGVAALLIAGGRSPDQPVAVVHAATTPHQRSAITTLGQLRCGGSPLPSPSIIIIGDVVAATTSR
jgi:uroporphyrin-III C-methyltransferase